MKSLAPLKESLKSSIHKEFLEIKKKAGENKLYVFALGRVEDIEGQYFAAASTIPYLKKQFEEDATYYSSFWMTSEMELTADCLTLSYEDLEPYLTDATDDEYDQLRVDYDQLLIDSLKELKKEDVFSNEIPEFSVFIEYADDAFDTIDSSYEVIMGTSHLESFLLRNDKQAGSLTEMLLVKYADISVTH